MSSPQALLEDLAAQGDDLLDLTRALVRLPSESPPSDTRAIVDYLTNDLASRLGPAAVIDRLSAEAPIDNLVVRLPGKGPGRRLIFNGHLDTYLVGDRNAWQYDPVGGELVEGRLYGRGSCDMKGGVAALVVAAGALARHRDAWPGELVLTLAGDEEVMGIRGTQYLIDRHSAAKGDGVICADVGGPAHLRLGEKGMIWLAVRAAGKMAHGAHVHRGINAIDRLRQAMDALATLRHYPVTTPKAAADTMARARVQRAGREPPEEATILQTLTVNFGRIEGGETANLVADRATVYVDIRLPLGVSVTQIEGEIHARLGAMEGIDVEVLRRYEPSWTDPADPVVQAVAHASQAVLDAPPLVDMRIGASDARLYRAAGVPTVVCGPTPHNLGAPDEYLIVGELLALAQIYVLAAWQFLNAPD